MTAPKRILDLIATFSRNREEYMSPSFNEAQLRQQFINPMFRELGWDMDNEQGYAEAYKDVIHEATLKMGDAVKAPDYCFRIGGTPKFYLEAKKPSVNLKDDLAPAYQLRRYGWTKGLPLSILTDFEEFAVYDCRVKPSEKDKASVARINYIRFEDYAAKWDEIAGTFSRDAVLKGSFDKYADSAKAKRGTATVDAVFLEDIEKWRLDLARNIALRNAKIGPRELNYAVQMTIDRIIFLRMCEARGIEPYGQLRELLEDSDIYKELCKLFRKADQRYNSGLFHFEKEPGRDDFDDLTPNLVIDDKVLKGIIKCLYYPERPYEFSVMPAEILGQVYEQFLGKVIRLTESHQAKVEEKPEVKKAGGVYYTPTYVVDYIVKHTVGKLLEGKTPKQATKLSVLDPACGSGSFLLGAYEYLLKWHFDYYMANGPEKFKKEVVQAPGGWRLTVAERKRILMANIYGVDIDPQAVEVTKLSLLLKVLEGESQDSLNKQLVIAHERALPDLASNIKCGNSLIGPDFYISQQGVFFDEEEKYRINVFDWNKSFPSIMQVGGFNAVIGNPPYGAYLHESEKDYLISIFPHQTYQLDSYLLFLEQSLRNLINVNGLYGMIIPNPWLTNLRQTKIRRLVMSTARVLEIVHFYFPVFPRVVVDTEIVLLEKANPVDWKSTVTIYDNLQSFIDKSESAGKRQLFHSQNKWKALDGEVINIFLSQEQESLAAKCKKSGVTVDSLFNTNVGIKPYQTGKGKPAQTASVVRDRPFDSDRQESPQYRQYLRGSDISRYVIAPIEKRFLKYGPWLAEPRPAAEFDAKEKILMRQTGDSLVATIDREQFLCLNNMHVLVPKSKELPLLLILGIINSRLLNWYYQTLNPEAGEALAEVKKANVARLPIRLPQKAISKEIRTGDTITQCVEQIIALNKQLAAAKTPHEKSVLQAQIDATDRQIDQLVYELYGLTDDEIRIVEEATAR